MFGWIRISRHWCIPDYRHQLYQVGVAQGPCTWLSTESLGTINYNHNNHGLPSAQYQLLPSVSRDLSWCLGSGVSKYFSIKIISYCDQYYNSINFISLSLVSSSLFWAQTVTLQSQVSSKLFARNWLVDPCFSCLGGILDVTTTATTIIPDHRKLYSSRKPEIFHQ